MFSFEFRHDKLHKPKSNSINTKELEEITAPIKRILELIKRFIIAWNGENSDNHNLGRFNVIDLERNISVNEKTIPFDISPRAQVKQETPIKQEILVEQKSVSLPKGSLYLLHQILKCLIT